MSQVVSRNRRYNCFVVVMLPLILAIDHSVVNYLISLETPAEVRKYVGVNNYCETGTYQCRYIRDFAGNSREANEFVNEFVWRRFPDDSSVAHARKSGKGQRANPAAEAAVPNAATASKRKKRRGRKKKVDATHLFFSDQANGH